MANEVTLLGFWPSTFEMRCQIAAAKKWVKHEHGDEDLWNDSELLLQMEKSPSWSTTPSPGAGPSLSRSTSMNPEPQGPSCSRVPHHCLYSQHNEEEDASKAKQYQFPDYRSLPLQSSLAIELAIDVFWLIQACLVRIRLQISRPAAHPCSLQD
ncbi:hypothetical protein EUGRSUZ_D01022 [Eucalyptus grandis]|uniref:Uncharacterized protein n=2 Tax=Eucalyptus grandis TaxID=71139 RepID=A0ACC3L6S8_EUCGR|nr:hypothetical protein EUGRSUZ_D01022 [Eucalyptus grandis]